MAASSIEKIKSLPALPSQATAIDQGQYTIATKQQLNLIPTNDEATRTHIWFRTPALTIDTIKHIRSIQLWAESRDQGANRERFYGNWTWFELAILENESSQEPKKVNDVEFVWKSHRNRFQATDFDWGEGQKFTEDQDLVHLLEDGNVVAVRICAMFTWSRIAVRNGYLVITIGDAEIKPKDVQYTKLVSEIQIIQDVIHETNVQTHAAFTPQIPTKAITQADAFATAHKTSLRVLSLDGGGVRGLASLLMLKAVMDKVHPNKKPWQVFDLIGGTSTGGLIAIMLGRLRMDVDDCITQYRGYMQKIFKQEFGKLGKAAAFAFHGTFYPADVLERTVKDLVRQRLGDENAPLAGEHPDYKPGDKQCKIFVMAVNSIAANNRAPVFLRSYVNSQNPSDVPNIKVWEAARATSAAPAYFLPMKVVSGDREYTFVDGGLQANNPLGWLWTEVLSVFGPARPTDCFLSIGTGIPANEPMKQRSSGLNVFPMLGAVPSIATNTQVMHILFRCLINAFAPLPTGKKYWRLNVGEEIPEWKSEESSFFDVFHLFEKEVFHPQDFKKLGDLDDVGKMRELEEMTNVYIKNQDQDISDCAAALMKPPSVNSKL